MIYTAFESVCYPSLYFSFISWYVLTVWGSRYYFAIDYPITC